MALSAVSAPVRRTLIRGPAGCAARTPGCRGALCGLLALLLKEDVGGDVG
ncbi:hypothetical protein ABT383_37330 [Streptomyces humidus]|nr:hypothetical protein [Streptomyces humidus]